MSFHPSSDGCGDEKHPAYHVPFHGHHGPVGPQTVFPPAFFSHNSQFGIPTGGMPDLTQKFAFPQAHGWSPVLPMHSAPPPFMHSHPLQNSPFDHDMFTAHSEPESQPSPSLPESESPSRSPASEMTPPALRDTPSLNPHAESFAVSPAPPSASPTPSIDKRHAALAKSIDKKSTYASIVSALKAGFPPHFRIPIGHGTLAFPILMARRGQWADLARLLADGVFTMADVRIAPQDLWRHAGCDEDAVADVIAVMGQFRARLNDPPARAATAAWVAAYPLLRDAAAAALCTAPADVARAVITADDAPTAQWVLVAVAQGFSDCLKGKEQVAALTAITQRGRAGRYDSAVLGALLRSAREVEPVVTALLRGKPALEAPLVHALLASGRRVAAPAFLTAPLPSGASAVRIAVRDRDPALLAHLLACGAAADLRDANEHTPLMVASHQGHAASVRALLGCGADPLAQDALGTSPVHMATKAGRAEALKLLLDHGGRPAVAQRDNRGLSALEMAVSGGRLDCVRLLLERGAAHEVVGDAITKILAACKGSKRKAIAELIQQADSIEAAFAAAPPPAASASASTPPPPAPAGMTAERRAQLVTIVDDFAAAAHASMTMRPTMPAADRGYVALYARALGMDTVEKPAADGCRLVVTKPKAKTADKAEDDDQEKEEKPKAAEKKLSRKELAAAKAVARANAKAAAAAATAAAPVDPVPAPVPAPAPAAVPTEAAPPSSAAADASASEPEPAPALSPAEAWAAAERRELVHGPLYDFVFGIRTAAEHTVPAPRSAADHHALLAFIQDLGLTLVHRRNRPDRPVVVRRPAGTVAPAAAQRTRCEELAQLVAAFVAGPAASFRLPAMISGDVAQSFNAHAQRAGLIVSTEGARAQGTHRMTMTKRGRAAAAAATTAPAADLPAAPAAPVAPAPAPAAGKVKSVKAPTPAPAAPAPAPAPAPTPASTPFSAALDNTRPEPPRPARHRRLPARLELCLCVAAVAALGFYWWRRRR